MLGALVQLVRMPACHAGGHEFESRTHRLNLGIYRGFFCILSSLNLVCVESNSALITVIFTVHLSVDVYKCRPRTAACSCNHYNPLVA